MRNPMRSSFCWAALALLLLSPACRGKAPAAADSHEAGHEPGGRANDRPDARRLGGRRYPYREGGDCSFNRRVTAPGELEFNARRLAHLTARTPGRVERVLAVSGDRVGAGQVLAEVYSPDFMSLQAEYLQAAERARTLGGDCGRGPCRPGPSWTARASDSSWSGPAPPRSMASPRPGSRSRCWRSALPSPEPSSRPMSWRATTSSSAPTCSAWPIRRSLWASLHIREKDLASLQAGAGVELRTQAYPGEVFRGRLLLVGDVLDAETRTVTGRVEVANPAGRLKAGMYVEAALAGAGDRNGPGRARGGGPGRRGPVDRLRPDRGEELSSGARSRPASGFGGQVEILTGLVAGETVVTSGSFLLKSEMHKGGLEDEHGHS